MFPHRLTDLLVSESLMAKEGLDLSLSWLGERELWGGKLLFPFLMGFTGISQCRQLTLDLTLMHFGLSGLVFKHHTHQERLRRQSDGQSYVFHAFEVTNLSLEKCHSDKVKMCAAILCLFIHSVIFALSFY